MNLADQVMAEVTAHPGSWTAADIAATLKVETDAVKQLVYRKQERGELAPRAYRLHAHVRAKRRAGYSIGRLVSRSSPRADGLALAKRIVVALERGPLTAKELAQSLGYGDALPGGAKRIIKTLDAFGVVSPPTCLWPVESNNTEKP
jgi:hypothetical protein